MNAGPKHARKTDRDFSSNDCLIITGAVFFPEGTSTDGKQVIACSKTTHFNRFFFAPELLRCNLGSALSPCFILRRLGRSAFYGWWRRDMRLWLASGAHAGVRAGRGKDHDLPHATGRRRISTTQKTLAQALRNTGPYAHPFAFE